MPRALRYKFNGQYLQNTLFSTTNSDYLGAHNGVPTDEIFDENLAALQQQQQLESHKQDYAIAFGIPAIAIECEVLDWDGDPATLPYADDSDPAGKHVRLPVEQRAGYVAPEPVPPTPLEIIANAILADVGTSQALKDAARAAIIAGGEIVSDTVVPMVPQKG